MNKLTCLICQKELKQLTTTHLMLHKLDVPTYKKMHPNASIFREQSRTKLSLKAKQQHAENPFFSVSEEANKKRSVALTGVKRSLETCAKISANRKRFCSTEEWKKQAIQRLPNQPGRRKYRNTKIEILMEKALQGAGISYRKHVHVLERYWVDFLLSDNLVVECDGDYWHSLPHIKEKDAIRNTKMSEAGYTIIRFSEKFILFNVQKCIDVIRSHMGGQEVWGNSGWRVITARAATSGGGVGEDGTLPVTIKPSFQQLSTKPKNVAHNFSVSEIQQFLGFEPYPRNN